ncbi:DNA cytosine methyltransferase [Lysinibacillus sp. FSL K6-0232]|uniref:DNA cytosine methyltransferase n=1 Tax=Lysinibacillus sp. FSL K6-0232 TaxID=2921425 RepID=UPI0030F67658
MTTFLKGELFCGPGGIALGAKNALIEKSDEIYKIKHVWANDRDESSCDTFRNNICPNSPESVINSNVEDLDIKNLPYIDAFTFGFPCNDFSGVGKQKGTNGYFGQLYKYGVEVINQFNPKWFLAENVSGLENSNYGADFQNILEELQRAGSGYDLVPHLYKFEEYGVPQYRHRIIIVGIRKDLNLTFKVPAPTHLSNFIGAKEALDNIPLNASNHEFTKHKQDVVDRLKHIPPGENVWYNELPEQFQLKVKGLKLSNLYRRLHPDKPSYTLTASGGGGTHGYHWEEARALTNRERARLQTFPDNYIFHGRKEEVRQQIGMAVPPKGVQIIFESILKTFAGIEYEHIEPSYQLNRVTVS